VLYDDHAVALERIGPDPAGEALWIEARDLPRLGGFELTADGACRGDLCIPLPAGSIRNSLLNFSAFAAAAGHAVVAEPAERIWSVSGRSTSGAMTSRLAPDIEVPDRLGRPVHLAGFRGRKALVITWASW
jgi:hypothetical protein